MKFEKGNKTLYKKSLNSYLSKGNETKKDKILKKNILKESRYIEISIFIFFFQILDMSNEK